MSFPDFTNDNELKDYIFWLLKAPVPCSSSVMSHVKPLSLIPSTNIHQLPITCQNGKAGKGPSSPSWNLQLSY